MNIIGELRTACNDKDNFPRMKSELCVNADLALRAADEIETLQKLLEKQQVIIRRIYAEQLPNTWFVCGELGNKDQNGLPDKIEVCPAYGVDWSQIYVKTERTIPGMGG